MGKRLILEQAGGQQQTTVSGVLEKEKVDLLFAPAAEEMYPPGGVTWVTVEGLSELLEGESRPGHFRGVATIVSKLFNIVEPDRAYFGQKDAAQLAVLRQMVRDLNFEVEIDRDTGEVNLARYTAVTPPGSTG